MITVDYIPDNIDAYVIHASEQDRLERLHKRFGSEESEDKKDE